MPQPPIIGGGVPLGGTAQITVTDMRILEPASLVFQAGGCDRPGSTLRAEVVDVRSGVVMFIPMNLRYAEGLHKQLSELIAAHNHTTPEE